MSKKGMLYIHGGLNPPEEEFRNLQAQLADPVVVLAHPAVFIGDLAKPSSGTYKDLFLIPHVPCARLAVEEVRLTVTANVQSTSAGYWTAYLKILDSSRNVKAITTALDTRESRFYAHKHIGWTDLDKDLEEDGGVLVRMTWMGTPPTLPGLMLSGVLRRGVG